MLCTLSENRLLLFIHLNQPTSPSLTVSSVDLFVCLSTTTAGSSSVIVIIAILEHVGARANYNVRLKLHRNLLVQEAAFFDSNEVGYLLSRLNNDVNKIGNVISFHVNIVTRQFAQFVFGSIYMLSVSRWLSLATFAGIGLVA